jgi:hypothetical protein
VAECDYAFRGYNANKFSMDDYELIYSDNITIKDTSHHMYVLEDLLEIFNCEIPEDFTGRSLSVSDIIQLDDKYYYCDDFGWKLLEI